MAEEQGRFSHRPESTIVQNFSADLDSMFGLGSGEGASSDPIAAPELDHIEKTVEEKKQGLNTADRELQELEARLRETERRLAQASRGNSPARQVATTPGAMQKPVEKQSPLAQKPTFPSDRPPTAREDTQALISKIPGALPTTPRQTSGSNDYVMVDRTAERGVGQSV